MRYRPYSVVYNSIMEFGHGISYPCWTYAQGPLYSLEIPGFIWPEVLDKVEGQA